MDMVELTWEKPVKPPDDCRYGARVLYWGWSQPLAGH